MTKGRKLIAAVAMAAASVFALAAPSMAASWHAITGTAYSNGAVYVSSNVRFMETTSPIKAQFTSLPKNGLVFGTNTQTGRFLGQNTWGKNEINITRGVSGGQNVQAGSGFVNFFRLQSGCTSAFGCTPYNFIGSESY